MNLEQNIQRMSRQLIFDILNTFHLPETEGWYQRMKPFLSKATDRLSHIALVFDQLITEKGFPMAAQWSLTNWCRGIITRGSENIPKEGPLLIVSNHPGAYDALVIAATSPRPDLHIIASDLPFFRYLQNLSQRIFFIPRNKMDTYHRMSGLLSAIRYLKNGGAVLLMGSGTIDPDPAVLPGAIDHLQRWTNAVDLFLHSAPETNVVLSAVSHILSLKWAKHPLTWLRTEGLHKRQIAEFGQILQQLFQPGSFFVSPRLSFAPALKSGDLGSSPRDVLVERESALLVEHCREFGGYPF